MKIYTYKACGTCKKALTYLNVKGVNPTVIPIRETPPSNDELLVMLSCYNGDIKRLFNISGQDYRALDMKNKLPTMTEDEAVNLLHQNGNLVKRPFLISDKKGLVGFKEDEWDSFLS